MRILFWTEQYWPFIGGLEVLATRYVRAMRQRGHDITVITGHGSLELDDYEVHQGTPIHRFRFYDAIATRDIELLLETRSRVRALKKSFAPDLVHVNIVAPSVFFHVQTADAHPSPVLVTQQLAALPGQRGDADTILGRLLDSADWVACCSDSLLEETRRLVPSTTDSSSVVYNGVDLPKLPVAPLPTAPHLVSVGRLVPEKGFDVAIQALCMIREQHPGATLEIIGEGPERQRLMSIVTDHGLDDAVRFTGWVNPDQIPHAMNRASLVLVPSRAEAFGLVALEAALMGRPVIATNVGGLPEVVIDGETGTLVIPDDPAALADAASALLTDRERLEQMGTAARERGVGTFTWESYVDAYETLYQRLARTDRVKGVPAPA